MALEVQQRLSLKNDFLFKRLFGDPDNKDILIGLLNAILQSTGRKEITDLTVSDNYKLARKLVDDKEGILDIHCETYDHELINVEMQVRRYPDMEKRSIFYMGKLFISSIRRGDPYSDLKKTICINLLDYSFLPLKQFHSSFHLYEDSNKQLMLTDMWELHFIEFEKFRKETFDIQQPLHRWLWYMDGQINSHQLKELIRMDPLFRKAEKRLTKLSADEETLILYEAREKAIRDQNSLVIAAGQDGVKKGMEMGIEKGIESVAMNMLQKGADLNFITEVTGLSVEQINMLK